MKNLWLYKKIRELREIPLNTSLANKIRWSYLMLVIPLATVIGICFYNITNYNNAYDTMINNTSTASEFSMDFKNDFDYKIYLIIVGNQTFEEADPVQDVDNARMIIKQLSASNENKQNKARVEGILKYLDNLQNYAARIQENIQIGGRYDENIEIWENDVQVVTSLIQDSILQYLYYETREIQTTRQDVNAVYIKSVQIMAFLLITVVIITLLLSTLIPRSITRPISYLSKVTDQVAKGNLQVQCEIQNGREVRNLSSSLNTMIQRLNELFDTVKLEQIHLREAELELLQLQINPHFLYNTLDTIVWLAEAGDEKQVVSMVKSLSEFFRTSLNKGNDLITIADEMKHATSYLEIQHVRYRDILDFEVDVDRNILNYYIPRITLQPLIENALYHGIKNKRGLGLISIRGGIWDKRLFLQVIDNGIGMTPDRLEQVREGIKRQEESRKDFYGLYNVNERIRLKFGEQYGLSITSTYGAGTTMTIELPVGTQP